MSKHQAMATKKDSGMANPAGREVVPDYMRQGEGRGSEAVEAQDLIIPRLEVVQALSPALDKGHAAYIEGAELGDIYNSVTREVYGAKVCVVPVLFKKEYLVWRDRKLGGGFRGALPTLEQAEERIQEQDKPEEYEALETAQQFVLVIREEGYTEQAVVSMSRTKMKVSRNWNSLIRLKGGDRFSRFYWLGTVDEVNANNQKYKNFAVIPGSFAPEVAYKEAEAIYTGLTSGTLKARVDDKYDDQDSDPNAGEPGPAKEF